MALVDSIPRIDDLIDPLGIPGLVFRGFQGETDYPKMLAVISGSKTADQIERTDTLEDIVNNYAHLTNCDPYQDMIFAEVKGEVVGYGRVSWRIDQDGQWLGFLIGFLLPDWRWKGIGGRMLRFGEKRLAQIALHLRETGTLNNSNNCFFEIDHEQGERDKESILIREGYQAVRYDYSMVRSLELPVNEMPMPPGLEVLAVQPEHYHAVWEASNEAFRDHWGYIEETEQDFQRWLDNPTFDPKIWQVAWDGDQVAGMVLNFVNPAENQEYSRKRGYTENISVRRPWRKRGLARALLTRSLKMFQDMGMTEAALRVDTENLSGALRLYESVGFQVVKRGAVYRKQFSIDMIS
jgi:mycothiol synthase